MTYAVNRIVICKAFQRKRKTLRNFLPAHTHAFENLASHAGALFRQ